MALVPAHVRACERIMQLPERICSIRMHTHSQQVARLIMIKILVIILIIPALIDNIFHAK